MKFKRGNVIMQNHNQSLKYGNYKDTILFGGNSHMELWKTKYDGRES
jgi:hypothetical protein